MTRHLRSWFLALALLAIPAAAQDRLEPVPPANDAITRESEANLRTAFREAYEPRVELRAFVHPSWAPEYAVGLRRAANGHEIFLLEPSLQISRYAWVERVRSGRVTTTPSHQEQMVRDAEAERRRLPPRVSDVPVQVCSAGVDEETAATLIRAWHRMLRQIEPNRDGVYQFDGVSYSFSMALDGRPVEGTTWRGTPPSLADAMADFCARSSWTSRLALWTGVLLALLVLAPAMLLLGAGLRRITGQRIPGIERLRPLVRRRGFRIACATVSIGLVSILAYGAISGWSSREVLRVAQVIAAGG
jgi:hypothetical protein